MTRHCDFCRNRISFWQDFKNGMTLQLPRDEQIDLSLCDDCIKKYKEKIKLFEKHEWDEYTKLEDEEERRDKLKVANEIKRLKA